MFSKRLALGILVLLVTPVFAFGQISTEGKGMHLGEQTNVKQLPVNGKRFALVIGVDRYDDSQITSLGGASNDAKALASALSAYAGFPANQVVLLASDQPQDRQPTKGNIQRRLSNLVGLVPKDGLLLIAFSGHGMERDTRAFLLPQDAQVSSDIYLLESTALPVAQMKEQIHRIGVGQVVLILDACRNDPTNGRSDSDNNLTTAYTRGFNFDVRNKEVQAFATIYATEVGKRAYEYKEKGQGYFTWALIEGLKGEAANDKGEVTLSSLVKYVQERVPQQVRIDLGQGKEQRPFADVNGYKADDLVVSITVTIRSGANAGKPVETTAQAYRAVDPAFELEYWVTIKNSKDAQDFDSYIAKYPNGEFVSIAKLRARQFTNQPLSTTTNAVATNGAANVPTTPKRQPTNASFASSPVLTQLSEAEIESVLRGMGYEYTKIKENTYKFFLEGYPVVLFNKDRNMQLYAGFKQRGSIPKVNEWNKSRRFSRTYIDAEGDPVIEADLDFDGGVTKTEIQEFVKTFKLSVTTFVKFLKDDSPATSPSQPPAAASNPSARVWAGDVATTISATAMQDIMRELGLEYTPLKAENTYKFSLDNHPVALFNKGRNMQLYAGFKAQATIAKINEWNRTHRFSRAYIDGDGDPVIEADLDFDGGATQNGVKEFIKTFKLTVTAFVKFLKE